MSAFPKVVDISNRKPGKMIDRLRWKEHYFLFIFSSILTIVWLSIGSVPALNKLTPANHLVERAAMLRDLKRQKEEVGLTIIWIVNTSVTLCSKINSAPAQNL